MGNRVVAKNYIYHTLYQVVMLITPLITTPYITRVLLPDGVGVYSFYYTLVEYFVILGNLGFSTYGQIQCSKHRGNKHELSKKFYEIFLLKLATYALSSLICFAVLLFSEEKYLMGILMFLLLAGALDISWFYFGVDDFKSVSIKNIAIRLLSICGIFIFVKGVDDLYIYAILLTGGTLFGSALLFLGIGKKICRVSFGDLHFREHIRPALAFFIPTIAVTIYSMADKTMIGLITDSYAQNGFYDQAHKIEQIFVQLLLSVAVVYRSQMAFLFHTGDEKQIRKNIEKAVKALLFLSVPMCFGLLAVSRDLVGSFLGLDFLESISILRVFCPVLIVISLSNCMSNMYLIVANKQKIYIFCTVAGAAINILLNFIFIFLFGALGAAFSSLISECVILGLFYLFSKRYFNFRIFLNDGLKCLVAAMLMFGFVMALSFSLENYSVVSLLVETMSGIIVYFVILYLLKEELLISFVNKILKKREEKDV